MQGITCLSIVHFSLQGTTRAIWLQTTLRELQRELAAHPVKAEFPLSLCWSNLKQGKETGKLFDRAKLRFQFGYALFQRSNRDFHLGGGVARCDVLRAVPIEGNDFDKEQPFHNALDFGSGELPNESGMLPGVFDTGVTEDFQPRALRIVHKEQHHTVGHGEVAGGKQLAVAFVVSEAKRGRTGDPQKPRLATAM